ncbi:hypothetical protein J6590_087314, partial [Homalodisca vitripennis]
MAQFVSTKRFEVMSEISPCEARYLDVYSIPACNLGSIQTYFIEYETVSKITRRFNRERDGNRVAVPYLMP